jgi:hypothetical protein
MLRKKANASKPWAAKTTQVIRKNLLEKDEHTMNVSAHEVTCVSCNQKIKLRNTRAYDATHWDKHKAACPRITLTQTVRSVKKVAVKKVSFRLHYNASYS